MTIATIRMIRTITRECDWTRLTDSGSPRWRGQNYDGFVSVHNPASNSQKGVTAHCESQRRVTDGLDWIALTDQSGSTFQMYSPPPKTSDSSSRRSISLLILADPSRNLHTIVWNAFRVLQEHAT
jgi:hypothetical protein